MSNHLKTKVMKLVDMLGLGSGFNKSMGSTPIFGNFSIASAVEQMAVNHKVVGSSPT